MTENTANTVKKVNIFSEKAADLFDEVQKKASVRTVTISDARCAVQRLEKQLTCRGIPKRLWTGLEITFSPHSQPFANSYQGRPDATCYKVQRGATTWNLIDVSRKSCNQAASNRVRVVWPAESMLEVGGYLFDEFAGSLAS